MGGGLSNATGRLEGATLDFRARLLSSLPLGSRSAPVPVSATLRAGATQVVVSGVIAGRPFPQALDMQASIAGDDLSALRRLFDLNVPPTPPYRLRGRLRLDEAGWPLEEMRGRIGDSDVAGHATFTRDPNPRLTGHILSAKVDLDDFGPLIGAPPRTGGGIRFACPASRGKASASV
jgi:uncharacterized protein involved in outer membrane biogenesis